MIHLNEADFFDALKRRVVNPKFLKPRVYGISDALIRKLGVGLENDKTWSLLLESLVEGRSIDELMVLEGSSLGKILACSVMRMNFSLFHRAVSCIEAGGRVYSVMFRLTNVEAFRDALMEADAVQMLMRMIGSLSQYHKSYRVHVFVTG